MIDLQNRSSNIINNNDRPESSFHGELIDQQQGGGNGNSNQNRPRDERQKQMPAPRVSSCRNHLLWRFIIQEVEEEESNSRDYGISNTSNLQSSIQDDSIIPTTAATAKTVKPSRTKSKGCPNNDVYSSTRSFTDGFERDGACRRGMKK
jgi:hypothetical protein